MIKRDYDKFDKQLISYVYEKYREKIPDCIVKYTKGIVNIRKKRHTSICYFKEEHGKFYVKFKFNDTSVSTINIDTINDYIDKSIIHFENNEQSYRLSNYMTRRVRNDITLLINNEKFINKVDEYKRILNNNVTFTLENAYLNYKTNKNNYDEILEVVRNYFNEVSYAKLTERNASILNLRISSKPSKSFEDIAKCYDLTRERIRQICSKSVSTIANYNKYAVKNLYLTDLYCSIYEKLRTIDVGSFLAYLYFNCNEHFTTLFINAFLHNSIKYEELSYKINRDDYRYKVEQAKTDKINKFNQRIYALIKFAKKRQITDEDFSRLSPQRVILSSEKEILHFNGESYYCESIHQKDLLNSFLTNNTFKQIKMHSLKVELSNNVCFYPDFQCLTHDNYLVLIDAKPKYKMQLNRNVMTANALKNYCEKYGFGYLVVDNRFNSYF